MYKSITNNRTRDINFQLAQGPESTTVIRSTAHSSSLVASSDVTESVSVNSAAEYG